jgi:hypothetical protein
MKQLRAKISFSRSYPLHGKGPIIMVKKYVSEARMSHYFFRRRVWEYAIFLFVLGALCMGIAYVSSYTTAYSQYNLFFLFYAGIGVATIGVGILAVFYLTVLSDREYDEWLASQENVVASSVLAKLRLDQKQIISRMLVVHGFVAPSSDLAAKKYNKKVYYHIGSDWRIRFSVNTLLYFVPLEHHIAVFYTDINAIEQSLRYQETSHYYYHDVVGLTADDQQIPFDYRNSRCMLLFQDFSLKVSNGDSVGTRVLVGIQYIRKSELKNMPAFITVNSEVDQTISALLMLLRAKKQGTP